MKIQLIMLTNPLLVSDEKPSKVDWVLEKMQWIRQFTNIFTDSGECKKIIAGIPELPSIDFSALSEEDCKKIGWVDVEKLAEKEYPFALEGIGNSENNKKNHWIKGFKAAQSLENKFSEEDMIGFSQYTKSQSSNIPSTTLLNQYKPLSQPIFDVEVEMEELPPMGNGIIPFGKRPKITNNSIKILRIL